MIPEEKRTFCTMHINLPASPNVVLWIIKSPLSSIVRRRLMACFEPVNERKSTENLRFIWIQTNRIFHFSRRLFAKHNTLSSWCRIFSSRSRSRKIRILSISMFFAYCCHGDIDFTKNCIWTELQFIVNHWWKVCSDRTRTKSLLQSNQVNRSRR